MKKIKLTDLEAIIEAKVEEKLNSQKEDDEVIEIEEEVEEVEETIQSEEVEDNTEIELLKEELAKLKEENKQWKSMFDNRKEEQPKLSDKPKRAGWK